jgi:hypothetical protein
MAFHSSSNSVFFYTFAFGYDNNNEGYKTLSEGFDFSNR